MTNPSAVAKRIAGRLCGFDSRLVVSIVDEELAAQQERVRELVLAARELEGWNFEQIEQEDASFEGLAQNTDAGDCEIERILSEIIAAHQSDAVKAALSQGVHLCNAGEYESMQPALREAEKALEQSVWHSRLQFPHDDYCILCGVGKEWAAKHGHQSSCALSTIRALLKENDRG
jgi:hypothetical protein